VRTAWGVDDEQGISAGRGFAADARYLRVLSCSEAIGVLDRAAHAERPLQHGVPGEVEIALAGSAGSQHQTALRRVSPDEAARLLDVIPEAPLLIESHSREPLSRAQYMKKREGLKFY